MCKHNSWWTEALRNSRTVVEKRKGGRSTWSKALQLLKRRETCQVRQQKLSGSHSAFCPRDSTCKCPSSRRGPVGYDVNCSANGLASELWRVFACSPVCAISIAWDTPELISLYIPPHIPSGSGVVFLQIFVYLYCSHLFHSWFRISYTSPVFTSLKPHLLPCVFPHSLSNSLSLHLYCFVHTCMYIDNLLSSFSVVHMYMSLGLTLQNHWYLDPGEDWLSLI